MPACLFERRLLAQIDFHTCIQKLSQASLFGQAKSQLNSAYTDRQRTYIKFYSIMNILRPRWIIVLGAVLFLLGCEDENEQYVIIDDDNLLNALINQGIDADGDGKISYEEAEDIIAWLFPTKAFQI